ncbi:hypothetical protein ACFP3Q_02080 [Nocardioides sp. GCM10027113]|uniref:hypothetical protein n=1 Tax=unclassified Nocardioides TaxID=2615069 RepID=UPI003613E688
MSNLIADQSAQIRHQFWASIVSSVLIFAGGLIAAWLLADAATDSAKMVADAESETTREQLVSQRDFLAFEQRSEAYANLGHMARDGVRKLSLNARFFATGKKTSRPIPKVVGEAHLLVREAAVDAQVVGDPLVFEFASCLIEGFEVTGKNLNMATANGLPMVPAPAARFDSDIRSLRKYTEDFVAYAADHYMDSLTSESALTDPEECPWELPTYG